MIQNFDPKNPPKTITDQEADELEEAGVMNFHPVYIGGYGYVPAYWRDGSVIYRKNGQQWQRTEN